LKTLIKLAENATCVVMLIATQVLLDFARAGTNKNAAAPGLQPPVRRQASKPGQHWQSHHPPQIQARGTKGGRTYTGAQDE